ncbi:3'-5' exoribonuclease domain-containing protein [Paracoccus sp. ME4]|uniref:3'-5' exoribonuclease domain-containing protein n=1 Tax=Paracoccus sp. ME4 TaxID=3138066 RepID=UPI00398A61C5
MHDPLLESIMSGPLRDRMLISFDTEFVDTGTSVELISIGLVRADGRELYLENADFPDRGGHLVDDWMEAHVMEKTFLRTAPDDERILPHGEIGARVRDFMLEGGKAPSLWAHYASYDFLAFSHLFGRMLDIPDGLPRHCMDFRVLQDLTGIKPPSQDKANAHHALVDARWGKRAFAAFGMEFERFDPARDLELPEPSRQLCCEM